MTTIKRLHVLSEQVKDAAETCINPDFLEYVFGEYRSAAVRWMFRLGDISSHCTARVFALEEELDKTGYGVHRMNLLWNLYNIWVCIAEDTFERLSAKGEVIA